MTNAAGRIIIEIEPDGQRVVVARVRYDMHVSPRRSTAGSGEYRLGVAHDDMVLADPAYAWADVLRMVAEELTDETIAGAARLLAEERDSRGIPPD